MSYIDNKSSLIRELQILELENELLRKQIKELKTKLNELLDTTIIERKIGGVKRTNSSSR